MRRLLIALLCVLAPTAAAAQATPPAGDVAETQLERDVRTLAAELRCPVCQGLSLQDSPSELSQEMKDVIRQQLAEGRTPEEVKAYFVSKYGEWILMEPKAEGFNLAVYALPIIGLIAGAAFVFLTARKWVRQGGDAELAEEEAAEEEARAHIA
ncbi:MAG TPA: cytochrome c-type biogenesis protein [Longimicrobiales bacterium]|nr:cytochrome c-type biogenesis protein [Longimicrobiales bacterium]